MTIRLGSNVSSLTAQRKLADGTAALAKSFERLSSGQRINRASDDAAGLAIADSLRATSRVFTQGIRNFNDGLSLLSIAEGALQELRTITTRQIELAEQAANGVYSSKQRQALNEEANALVDEFNRIVESTSFNGLNVLDGSLSELRLQGGFGLDGSLVVSIAAGTSQVGLVGDGTFQAAQFFTAGVRAAVNTGDFNADGATDIFTTDQATNNVNVLLGNGDGSFKARQAFATGAGSTSITSGDFNADGVPDIVTADSGSASVNILLGNGDGSFKARQAFAAGANVRSVTTSDFNGDSIIDLVTADMGPDTISVLLGNGDGSFKARQAFTAGNNPMSVTTSDFNGDSIADLVTADYIGNSVSVLLGNGDGSFKARQGLCRKLRMLAKQASIMPAYSSYEDQ